MYKDTDVNISSGRSLTTGIGSSQGIVEIGKTALNAVTQYANAKTNYDAKMRRLEINTNVSLSKAQFGGNNQLYVDGLKSRDDYLTPDNWLNDYEADFKKQELNYKKQLDEQIAAQKKIQDLEKQGDITLESRRNLLKEIELVLGMKKDL